MLLMKYRGKITKKIASMRFCGLKNHNMKNSMFNDENFPQNTLF